MHKGAEERALYTNSCGCSKGGFIDKYVRDPNKTPDSSQRPPHDCSRCGSPVDGLYCRHCALLRKKLKDVLFTIYDEHKFFQDFLNTFESSNDDSNVVSMPQELVVFNQDPDENSLQSPPQINHHCCYGCDNSLDGIFCQQCTCKSCGKGAHYGYNCPLKVPIISNPEPCHDQNVEEFPQTLPCFHPTCYSGDENSFAYDSTPNLVKDSPNVFNPHSQPSMYSNEFCRDNAHYSYDYPPQVQFIYDPEPCYNQDFNFPQNFQSFQQQCPCCENCGGPHKTFQCQQVIFYNPFCENYGGPHETVHYQPMNYYEPKPCYNYSGFDNFQPSQPVIDHLNLQQRINDSMIELCRKFQAWLQQRKDQVCQKIPLCYDDDEDEESSIPLRDIIISELSLYIAITPVVSTKDSLIMGDEYLDTIPKKESDEFIKSSVENLDPNLSEFKDEHECDVPACDDFTAFSNLLFDIDDDFSSSDNKSFSDEDIPKEIYSNLLFDEEIISIKTDPHHFNTEKIISKNSDAAIKSFSPSPIPVKDSDSLMEEIDLSLTPDDSMPPGIEEDDYESEGDILILEELLSNDSLSLPENESFHFDIPSSPRPPAKPLDDDVIEPNSGILTVKIVVDIFEHYVPIPRLLPTQPTLASNQEKPPHLLSHRGLKAFQLSSKSLMMIYGGNIPILDVPFLHFYPP
nr:hypothetical protein [Tanacetum cinerariifolium]